VDTAAATASATTASATTWNATTSSATTTDRPYSSFRCKGRPASSVSVRRRERYVASFSQLGIIFNDVMFI
jgi:hypothetical protein